MRSTSMNPYGELRIDGDLVRYTKGRVSSSLPPRSFALSVRTIRIVGELTREGGPVLDYFYVFVAGEPPEIYLVPMESLEGGDQMRRFFQGLEEHLGGQMHHSLSFSTHFATSVMWTQAWKGQRLFDEVRESRAGRWGRWLDRLRPRWRLDLTTELQRALGMTPKWAGSDG